MKSKHLQHIITILLAVILFSCAGESKDENTSAVATESAKSSDDINADFSALEEQNAILTTEQLKAFESRAIQKFQDFTDYVKIISDPEVDDDLKEHSLQLALELFVNDSILLIDSNVTITAGDIILKEYLNKLKSRKKPVYITIESIHFSEPLALDSLNNYKGKIEISLKINGEELTKNIEVCLVEIDKEFGENEIRINEIRLGNIY